MAVDDLRHRDDVVAFGTGFAFGPFLWGVFALARRARPFSSATAARTVVATATPAAGADKLTGRVDGLIERDRLLERGI